MMVFVFSSKNVYAGTCSCEANGGTRMWFIGTNNCDTDEYASGCEGSLSSDPRATCECIKKATTGNTANTCTCSGSGVVTADNCVDSKPYCNTRESVICICTGDGTLDTVGKNTSDLTESSSYDPFGNCSNNEIDTALGCIPTEMNSFVPWLMSWLFGVAGGIAFLLMVYGFILIATSSGDEKKVQGAKETITSAIVGLLVCIFAVFILKLIAVNILKIPGIN